MKIIRPRELSARPGGVWELLANEDAAVVTRDGVPAGVLSPTKAVTFSGQW